MPSSVGRTLVAVGLAVPIAAYGFRLLRRRLRQVRHSSATAPTTLDPSDWEALRRNAHELLDASLRKMANASEGRVWTPVPDELKQRLQEPLPTRGIPLDQLRRRLQELLPYGAGNTHPRFFGWVHGSGSPGGMLPELVGAAMNANCGGRDHVHLYVERQVLAWARTIMGFPADCGGLLVSGTSMATILALKAARDSALGFSASRKGGLADAQRPGGRLVAYAAEGTHSCVKRALDVLGLGSDALRLVPTSSDFTMDVEQLTAMIDADRRDGLAPFLVVGTAGSVNVGAIDDLSALADVCDARGGLWLHVDGAFGAVAKLSPEAAPWLAGLERASSLAFDFHKWLHVNYDAGCVLVRSNEAHLRAFSDRPDYLAANERGLAAGSPWAVDYGIELSRGFRALKVWSHLLEHGTERLGAAITANLAHARHLAALVDAEASLQRLAPTKLQIVVFRYLPADHHALAEEHLNQLNDDLVVELQVRGIAVPSTTKIRGQLAIRVNLTNHRTRNEDLELLVAEVKRIGAELSALRAS